MKSPFSLLCNFQNLFYNLYGRELPSTSVMCGQEAFVTSNAVIYYKAVVIAMVWY